MSHQEMLRRLHAAAPLIGPSLLACDFARLGDEIHRLEDAGAKVLHLDVMDGHFVPNLSFGIPIVEAVRRTTDLPLDVHLMLSEPGRYVRQFRDAGADLMTFHVEAVPDPVELLDEIRSLGAAAGVSLNPPTPVERLENCVDHCDLVLVMSVMPGFAGQSFQPGGLEKLRWLRARAGGRALLAIDGGVARDTIDRCAEAGADLFVMGSALFVEEDYGQFIEEMVARAKANRS